MRVAISGTHRTGKSTLVSELSRLLPAYTTVDEPYHLMEEEGYDFSYPLSLEDFEAQLERSIQELGQDGGDVLFDRCPLDFLAYIALHEDADLFDQDEWIPRVREALETIDFVVFVPIEARDRIALSSSDDEGASREAVDQKLQEILFDDPFELGVEVLEVEGDPERRARAVLRRVAESRRRG
jgi:predicted ATPase